jgi:hypothetical protein
VPEAILTDNGKVFTGRFGTGTGEVLFDRICRENGIRRRLTAPHSPTTTGKVERFHKTLKREFLDGKVFESIADAQAQLDGWVHEYNYERAHQSVGDRAPIERFRLAKRDTFAPVDVAEEHGEPERVVSSATRSSRRVGAGGKISLAGRLYHAGRWLTGETVEVVCRDGLVELVHDGVLIATHARRHPPDKEQSLRRGTRKLRPATVGHPVTRKVDGSGSSSFAGWTYRVGNRYRRRQVEIAIVADTVQISFDGQLVKTHPIRHDRAKEHGAFANPGGRPRRINAA